MTQSHIEIIVSGDNAAETLEQITSQLPTDAQVVTDNVAVPTLAELFASGLQASSGLGQLVNNWFAQVGSSAELQPFMTLVICAAIFVAVYLAEQVITKMTLGNLQRRSSDPATDRHPIGAALQWGIVKAFGLLFFFAASFIAIKAIIGSENEASALASVALSSVMLPRAWLFCR